MPIPASTIFDQCYHDNDEPEDEPSVDLGFKLKRQLSTASLTFDPHLHLLEGCDDEQLDPAEFVDIQEIGWGNGGMVFKSIHLPTRSVTARKIFNSRIPTENKRKMLQRELKALQKCCSPFILHYYGAIVSEFQVSLILEYMDRGSLSDVLKRHGPIPERILGRIAFNVLNGLVYLYDELNMIHRDLKPSNILLNSKGEVKLCDFGDSVELINSKAGSVVGTIGYMAPERIQGHHYTITSDVWSFGVTMMELATGLFPFAFSGESLRRRVGGMLEDNGLESIAIVELLEGIVNDPLPVLDQRDFSNELCDFISICMIRDPHFRPSPMKLLAHPFIQRHRHESIFKWLDGLV